MEVKRGNLVNIYTYRGIVQERVVSVGGKFITTDHYKFHRKNLREVDPIGISAYIIEDLEKFHQDREKMIILDKIRRFNFNKLSLEDLDKIRSIIDNKEAEEVEGNAQVQLQM